MCLRATTTPSPLPRPASWIVMLLPNASSGLGMQDTMAPAGTSLKQTLPLDLAWFPAQNTVEQNPWKAENMYKAIRANNPDLMGAQEINDHAFEVIGHLGSDYKVAGSSSAGHAIIYREP